jgi:curved DNA-binding protein CbpA
MKTALTYHPDRNPGRESEVTAKFQKIQSAHEVLSDAQERAKYDRNRLQTPTSSFRQSYNGPTSSNVRGNPWANAGSQWVPPPKPPPTARKAPPPSTGAQRYKNFETPKTSANQAAQEGAEARKNTYEAWEHMRNQRNAEGVRPGPGRTWKAPQAVPNDYPKSGREESNSFRHAPPPRPKPGYDEFRAGAAPGSSSHRRAQSSSATNRKGFMPNTPGGDEGPAPKGAYSGYSKKPNVPPPPPRDPESMKNAVPDPLREFRERADPTFEPRLSTPYATHGGEKLNPFETANFNRSKSTRERSDKFDSTQHVPRTGSDPNLASPHRSNSFANRSSTPRRHFPKVPSVGVESSSSDDGPEIKTHGASRPRPFATPKSPATATSKNEASMPDAAPSISNSRKPSRLREFQTWWKEEGENGEYPLNGFPPDGPPGGSGQANRDTNGETMYATPQAVSLPDKKRSVKFKLPTVSESLSSNDPYFASDADLYSLASQDMYDTKWSHLSPDKKSPATPPSGVAAAPNSLNAFEGLQRNLVDQLLNKQHASHSAFKIDKCPNATATYGACKSQTPLHDVYYMNQNGTSDSSRKCQRSADSIATDSYSVWTDYRESAEAGSPSKKQKPSIHFDPEHSRHFWRNLEQLKSNANHFTHASRFSFNVDDNTFKRTYSQPNGFRANSTENISTKFTPEDWDGKFEAGADYFRPEQKAANVTHRGRAQSGSRSRGRSPTKVRPVDPKFMPPREVETPLESPGGTKFSAEEWAQSFKPQTFAPPPIPSRTAPGSTKSRRPTLRPTMGTAAVVDYGDTSDEKPLFTGRKSAASKIPTPPSPDAMDVDTPPIPTTQIPTPSTNSNGNGNGNLKVNTESPQKRPAAPSTSASPTDIEAERLKVNFDDLKIQDIISSLELPCPPTEPQPPSTTFVLTPTHPLYFAYKESFKAYMHDWDLFNHQIMLHIVARKIQNDALGARRWEDETGKGVEIYRRGLKEDELVLGHLQAAMMSHEMVMTEWAVVRERVRRVENQNGGERLRVRKKTH